jgi:electron transport complex protein RnfG
MKSIIRYGFILSVICLVATGLLAFVNSFTKTKINQQAQAEIQDSLKVVLPDATLFEPVRSKDEILYYKALDANKNLLGVAFTAKNKGYSSDIETMVGMRPDGTITAIKILNQNETPGLGSKITEVKDDTTIFDFFKGKRKTESKKPWFQEQFLNKKISELDDIQAITGATISSNAVIISVKIKAQEILKSLENENINE